MSAHSPATITTISRTFSSEGKQPHPAAVTSSSPVPQPPTATHLLSIFRGQGAPSSSLPVPTAPPPALHQPRDPLRLKSDPENHQWLPVLCDPASSASATLASVNQVPPRTCVSSPRLSSGSPGLQNALRKQPSVGCQARVSLRGRTMLPALTVFILSYDRADCS